MWVATKNGFFSAVRHRENPEVLVIRGRSRADIAGLVEAIAGGEDFIAVTHDNIELATVVQSPAFSDYPWRTFLFASDWAEFLSTTAEGIDYDNFKNAVKTVNSVRADTYMKVWSDILGIESEASAEVTRGSWDDDWGYPDGAAIAAEQDGVPDYDPRPPSSATTNDEGNEL